MLSLANLHRTFTPSLSRVGGVDKLFDVTAYYESEPVDYTTNGYWMIESESQPTMIAKAKRKEISKESKENADRITEGFLENQPKTELYLGKWFDLSNVDGNPLLRVRSADKSVKIAMNAYFMALMGSIHYNPIMKGDDPLKPVFFYRSVVDSRPYALCMPVRYRF